VWVFAVIISIMLKIAFYGGAQEITGANYLLENSETKVLIDCGLFQGVKVCEDKNWDVFPFSAKDIKALFVTHGHLDHIGRIPKLLRDGFNGRIFSTSPTRDFSRLMLIDSLGILSKEAAREKREVFYSEEDVEKAMSFWEVVEYDKPVEVGDLNVTFREAGHILGSAMIEIEADGKKIVFSGDLGNPPTPLLKEPYKFRKADYLIVESAYGNREHEGREERKIKLERVIEDTIKAGGVLMIPAFSLERTQELLFEFNDLVEHGRIPSVPVFLDSPLAIHATEIYKKYESYFNKEAKYLIDSGDDIFKFFGLEFTLTTEQSRKIIGAPNPKIIIAGSGMSTGGRIIHHERAYLPDPNNTLLLMSFQSPGSLGRKLQDGDKKVRILGEEITVNARVEAIGGYSAHADSIGLLDFIDSIPDLKKVFVVQGEPAASMFLTQRARDYLGVDAVVPSLGDSFDLV